MTAKRVANYFVIMHDNRVIATGATLSELHESLKAAIGYDRVYQTFWRTFNRKDRYSFKHGGKEYHFQKVL